jgi:hypothetical protein
MRKNKNGDGYPVSRRTKTRNIALFALAGFLANILLPLWGVYAVPSPSSNTAIQSAFADGTQVLICTPEGLKWVSVETPGEEDAPAPANGQQCPFCCQLSHGAKCFQPACDGPVVYAPAVRFVFYASRQSNPGRTQIFVLGRTVRGPPLTA